ncbi:hypothetical protein Y88_1465 [Novosphingobium nitrogenifigens DSM 19370]|uniref:Uncharacterized protein n=1 Tax=Novosphingobium nitrogenifigens DSM 19370 TaxID=983920 RepID=F1Z7C1_9SPHN|nr:hypothetical protein Y88_1465 [Novosphingobium nitrogenifigens DSM 19370]
MPRIPSPIHRKTRTIRASARHHHQHVCQELAQLGFERRILQEQPDDSTHVFDSPDQIGIE